jgi:cardiolipin synthase
MAVASDGGKSRRGRPSEREAGAVLARSPLNLANVVTFGRLLMVVPVVWLIAIGHVEIAFWLFAAAGVSDVVDGFIAKNFNARTELGAYLDPLADKVLLNSIYVAMAMVGWLPVWLAFLVILRDLLIIVGVVLIQRRYPIYRAKPLLIGKANTFVQLLLAGVALAHAGGLVEMGEQVSALIIAVALTTLASGGGYAIQAVKALHAERKS